MRRHSILLPLLWLQSVLYAVMADSRGYNLRVVISTTAPLANRTDSITRSVLGNTTILRVQNANNTTELLVSFQQMTLNVDENHLSLSVAERVRTSSLFTSQPTFIISRYAAVIAMIADDLRIPYLTTSCPDTTIEYINRRPAERDNEALPVFTFMLHPSNMIMHTAVIDLIRRLRWEEVAILYEFPHGVSVIGHVMETSSKTSVRAWRFSTKMTDDELRNRLLDIRQQNSRNFVVYGVSHNLLRRIFASALRLSMLSYLHSWLVGDSDRFAIDYSEYSDTMVNLTTFDILHDDVTQPLSTLAGYSESSADELRSELEPLSAAISTAAAAAADEPLTLEQSDEIHRALISDSVTVIRSVLENWLNRQQQTASAPNGKDLAKLLSESPGIRGLTGPISFSSDGQRNNVTLRILSLTSTGLKQIGVWQQSGGSAVERLQISYRKPPKQSIKSAAPLGRGVVKIVTIVDPPFVMRNDGEDVTGGNDRWKGYLIDLIDAIATEVGFRYQLYEVPDGNYGGITASGEWNGMIRELLVGNASMCLGAISITALRESAVDFTKPFKQKQFNLLMLKPTAKRSIFQFMWPLSGTVWFLTLSGIVVVTLALALMDRFSPNVERGDERFGLAASAFFVYGTLVGPGTDRFPGTFSGRILSAAWWFFGLILVSSYTANLAAVLTVTRIDQPIRSVADLAAQTSIKYGTVKNTYAASMFSKSGLSLFQKMWQHMSVLHPESMVDNTTEGIRRVRQGNYAFIWDEPINKYLEMNEEKCDLMATGEPFDEKGYGIGVPIGAAYRDDVTMAILRLGERGEIKRFEDRWWTGGKCTKFKETTTSTKELDLQNFAGVFLVLAVGISAAIFIWIIELLLHRRGRRPKLSQNHKEVIVAMQPLSQDGSAVPV